MLKVKNITKYYDKTLGVKDLSFEVKEGEIFGFIGPNGAGKSTTIKCIMGLINMNKGEIFFENKPLLRDDIKIKEKIGYLSSDLNFYEDLRVNELLNYNRTFYEKDISEKEKYLVNKLKLDLTKKVNELSFGNKRKLGIVLALCHSPKLIILDEASTGLDPIMQNIFYEILLEEKKLGNTIFFSSHILSEVKKICDRVGIIKEGHLVKVEEVKKLSESESMKITVYSKEIEKIKKIASKIILVEEEKIVFMCNLNYNQLLLELNKIKIEKLLIEEASIEEIFLHYYE